MTLNFGTAGELQGCQVWFKIEVPEATYFHCSSRQLNLGISKASSVPEVYRMVSTMKQLKIFFKYSPKRQHVFEHAVKTSTGLGTGLGQRQQNPSSNYCVKQDGLSGTQPLRISTTLQSILHILLNKSANLLCTMMTLHRIQRASLRPVVSCKIYEHLNSLLHFMSAASLHSPKT